MPTTTRTHGFGPRAPRPARRGDYLIVLFAIVLWGLATGSPLMRPKQSIAVDTPRSAADIAPAMPAAPPAPSIPPIPQAAPAPR